MSVGNVNRMSFSKMWDSTLRRQIMERIDVSVDCDNIHCLRHDTNNKILNLKDKQEKGINISSVEEFDRFI